MNGIAPAMLAVTSTAAAMLVITFGPEPTD
jgi:hypothetical protein